MNLAQMKAATVRHRSDKTAWHLLKEAKRKQGTSRSTAHATRSFLCPFQKNVPSDSRHECTHIRVNVFDKGITMIRSSEVRRAATKSCRLQLYTVLRSLARNYCTIDCLLFVTLPRINISSSSLLPFCNADRSQTTERMTKQYTNKSVASL